MTNSPTNLENAERAEMEPNPMQFFSENVDQWGPAEWFDRLAKAIREQDKAVVAGDEIAFETYRMIAASSAMHLVREHESRIRSCLLDKPEAVEAEPIAWLCSGEGEGWKQDNRITFDREEAEKLIGVEGWTVKPLGVIKERSTPPAAPARALDGWQLVPKEPTPEIIRALFTLNSATARTTDEVKGAYQAILNLSASPSPVDGWELIERLVKALRKAEETLGAYADPTGYTDNQGEQLPADAEVHDGLAAADALVEVRSALLAAKEQQP